MDTYFGWEKSESLVFLALGLLGIGLGFFLWWQHKSPLLQGAIAPLLVLGLISAIVGGTIFFHTDAQVSALKEIYHQDTGRVIPPTRV